MHVNLPSAHIPSQHATERVLWGHRMQCPAQVCSVAAYVALTLGHARARQACSRCNAEWSLQLLCSQLYAKQRTCTGKLGVYKRGGHRVIVNALGDCIVRPSPLEASLRQIPAGAGCSGTSVHGCMQQLALYIALSWFI